MDKEFYIACLDVGLIVHSPGAKAVVVTEAEISVGDMVRYYADGKPYVGEAIAVIKRPESNDLLGWLRAASDSEKKTVVKIWHPSFQADEL